MISSRGLSRDRPRLAAGGPRGGGERAQRWRTDGGGPQRRAQSGGREQRRRRDLAGADRDAGGKSGRGAAEVDDSRKPVTGSEMDPAPFGQLFQRDRR